MAIVTGLFLLQRHGAGAIGRCFGPVMLLWFLALGVMGAASIAGTPEVLRALSPHYALVFIAKDGWIAFLAFGSVFLAVTGAEALYADMGHFGRRPIRLAWFVLVLPSLMLNYLGQGALLLHEPQAVENPFYRLAPSWALYPLVVLATLATGCVVGMVNGLLYVKGRLPHPFIPTLAMLTAASGLALYLSHSQTIQGAPPAVNTYAAK